MPRRKSVKKDYIYAVGRRKLSVARVRLFRGKGKSTVNEKSPESYFPGETSRVLWEKPFLSADAKDKYYVSVRVLGGGKRGQLEAVVHAIAKALAQVDKEKYKTPLKKAGLLTRDARIRERRKVGTGGKARRKKQSPKR